MATKIAKALFLIAALLALVAGLLPLLRGRESNTSALGFAVVFLVLGLALRPRRTSAAPSGPGA
jgi:hypothetical protein